MAKIETYSTATPTGADILLGSDSDASNATKNFTVSALPVAGTAPGSASADGVPGQMAMESGWLYVCVAADEWQRVAIATWL